MSEAAYAKALANLFAARRSGIDFGLERISQCLRELELSHEPRASVQVAGTNGKGSTSAFIAEVLRRAGYRVGVFSSPHLLTICERFRIDGQPIARADFVRAYEAVAEHGRDLTFFEQITAMAAWIFDDAHVDVAIYEVGLGGRLDSTTALPASLSVVTGIGLDHCEFLGDTLEQVAAEKAGVFREGVPAVIGLSAPQAIRAWLASQSRHAIMVGAQHEQLVPEHLAMAGPYQRRNAACAVAAIMALRDQGLQIDAVALNEGLSGARLSGRMEELSPGLCVDGAHNPQAARALSEALEGTGPWTLVVGLSSNKDIVGFLEPLKAHCGHLIATSALGDRSYPADEVARVASELGFSSVMVEPDAGRAVAQAREEGRPVLVTGSLLLLGEVLAALGYPGADPQLVTDPGGARA